MGLEGIQIIIADIFHEVFKLNIVGLSFFSTMF